MRNGELLVLADKEFDALVTMDRGIEFQQNLRGFKLILIVISAHSNRLQDIIPIVPNIERTIKSSEPGQIIQVIETP